VRPKTVAYAFIEAVGMASVAFMEGMYAHPPRGVNTSQFLYDTSKFRRAGVCLGVYQP
jgi:hypothetical protein